MTGLGGRIGRVIFQIRQFACEQAPSGLQFFQLVFEHVQVVSDVAALNSQIIDLCEQISDPVVDVV